jgi:peptidoglycan/xylan/chitin deacetylase (PgdA/CDA1 family)
LFLRRLVARWRSESVSGKWPVLPGSEKKPAQWEGWPGGKKFAFVLTHDIECQRGYQRIEALVQLEMELGLRSSFNFVPERYTVEEHVRKNLQERGFEVGVHGLKHDGKLYSSRNEFLRRAQKINQYGREWGAVGFRSPSMHHNLEWLLDLDFQYDASTFDTDPFEPQPDGIETIFPVWVPGRRGRPGYIELPYTIPQDVTLFAVLCHHDASVWKRKLDWVAQHGGMVLINTHPDYMYLGGGKEEIDEYPIAFYRDFLEYVQTKYADLYWHALPCEVARFWRNRPISPEEDFQRIPPQSGFSNPSSQQER